LLIRFWIIEGKVIWQPGRYKNSMNNIRPLATLLIAVVLAGCGSPQVWYQAGNSFEQTRRDLGGCRAEAARLTNPLAMVNLGFALADDANKKDFVNNCMIAKGYYLVDKNSLPAGVVGVSK
jgi:hypothetical protein